MYKKWKRLGLVALLFGFVFCNPAPDQTPPVLTLQGAPLIEIYTGESFNDPGAVAVDDVDGDITGRVQVGGDEINSNQPGEYLLTYTVQDQAGNAAQALERTVRVLAQPAPDSLTENRMGMNFVGLRDFFADRLFADLVKTSRAWRRPSSNELANLDANGWPTEDAENVFWHEVSNMHGTYRLSFTGSATITPSYNATLQNVVYDAAHNHTSAELVLVETGSSFLSLRFTDTVGGIRDLRLMRPLTPGSNLSYPETMLFTEQFKSAVSDFQVLRYMDYLGTNSNKSSDWESRPLVSDARQGVIHHDLGEGWLGRGGAWEHAVQLANETGTDMWINIPALVDDVYIQKLALLLRYGSDGREPYTAPQLNPVHPPLRSDLKVYIEFSNELWNQAWDFSQHFDVLPAAQADPIVTYDGASSDFLLVMRYTAKRTVDISKTFRGVFGDRAMMSRIRPILAWQQGFGNSTPLYMLAFLDDYFNNQAGDNVPDPQPVDYYIWGGGGSAYYGPELYSGFTLDTMWDNGTMDENFWIQNYIKIDAAWCAAYGIRYVAYEGGPLFDDSTPEEDTVKQAAVTDARLTDTVVQHHDAWTAAGGRLLMYFNLVQSYRSQFMTDVVTPDSPKMDGIKELRSRAPASPAVGRNLPLEFQGRPYDATSRGWSRSGPGSLSLTDGVGYWFAYMIHSETGGEFTVTLNYMSYIAGSVDLYYGSDLIGTLELENTAGEERTSLPLIIQVDPGRLKALRLWSRTGNFININSISVL